MKKDTDIGVLLVIGWILFCIIIFSLTSHAQTTAVTATVTAPDSQVFANGIGFATFTSVSGNVNCNRYTLNGAPFPCQVTFSMDGSGTFSVTLSDDHKIQPSGGRWNFTLCSQANISCTNSVQDVFGTNLNLSTGLSAAVVNFMNNTTTVSRFYQNGEVNTAGSVGGLLYYNLIDKSVRWYDGTTWHIICDNASFITGCTGGGGGAVSITGSPLNTYFTTWSGAASITGVSTLKASGVAAHTFIGNPTDGSGAVSNALIASSDIDNWYAAGGGTAQIQTVTWPAAPSSYKNGMEVRWLPSLANTGADPTINVNSVGALTVKRYGNQSLVAGDIDVTQIAQCTVFGSFCLLQNPLTVSPINPNITTYHVDGLVNKSICALISGLPANTISTVYWDILETNINCNPYTAGSGTVLQLYGGRQNAQYTFNVPITINKTNAQLIGLSPGRAGNNIYHGFAIGPSGSYSNPFANDPSGFTLSVVSTGCGGNFPPAGVYQVGVSWMVDAGGRESKLAQETALTIDGSGTQCFKFVPPVSPPASISFYNGWYCRNVGCASGSEVWQFTQPIANTFTTGAFASGSGTPPAVNTTGAFLALEGGSAPASAQNVIFGAKVQNVSIDCNDVANCIGGINVGAEEKSGFFTVDFNNIAGHVCLYWGGYSIGLGASNSSLEEISGNLGSISNPDTTCVYLDSIETMRGFNKFTITQTTPICIIAKGSTQAPFSGTFIGNGHLEKCGTAGIFTIGFRGVIEDVTCSPTNIATCVHFDATSVPAVAIAIRGGNADNPVTDDSTGYIESGGYTGFFTNQLVYYNALSVGPPTDCTATGIGATGTCTVFAISTSTSHNHTGRIILNTTGGGEADSGTVQLNFHPNYGNQSASCVLMPMSGNSAWLNGTSVRGSATGTGHSSVVWVNGCAALVNGACTGTPLTDASNYQFEYICEPY